MTLLADLRRGTYGLRFNPPSSLDLEVDQDTFTSFRDEEHQVDWYLEFSPLIVDLSIGHDDILREDLRIDTIAVFESYFEQSRKGSGSSAAPPPLHPTGSAAAAAERLFSEPRTRREPTWSRVVSVERITFFGVPALEVIHRLAYTAGDELIIGRIIIALEQGTLYFSALRRANMTGVRESLLSIIHTPSSNDGAHQHPQMLQAEIDAPALDDKFPDHPLTVIRRALRWALTTPMDVTVMAPLPLDRDEIVELPNSGCTIRLPPRFRFCAKMAAAMDPSLTPFIRATVPQTGSYSFDVWRVPDVTVTGRQALQQLRRLAEEHVRGWKHEGDPDFDMESGELPLFDGRPMLSTFVRFRVDGHMNHALANWFIDHDGRVFRVCAAGSLSRSREELMRVVHESTLSWKRLPGDSKTSSKWWDIFST